MFPIAQLVCRSGGLSSRISHLRTTTSNLSTLLHSGSGTNFSRCFAPVHIKVICRTLNSSSTAWGKGVPSMASLRTKVAPAINKSSKLWASTQTNAARVVEKDKKNKTLLLYIGSVFVFMTGLAYCAVPCYRMFCAATGFGGVPPIGHESKLDSLTPVKDRILKIKFNADIASSMRWSFKPQQPEVTVVPGETALAFYKAKNPTAEPIIGISTYNIIPYEAGPYFNKIQCFCFEEQRLNPHEEVDMPVFFYIDPDIMDDVRLENINEITLSYTFFESKEGMTVPLPGYMQAEH